MRAHFFWPSCGLDMVNMGDQRPARPMFWISATPEEVADKVSTWWTPDQVLAFQNLTPIELEDSYEIEGRYYFFVPAKVPADRSDPPVLDIYVRPYSGMWNGRRPWIAIGPRTPGHPFNEPEGIEIKELADLWQLRFDLLNCYHLTPNAA